MRKFHRLSILLAATLALASCGTVQETYVASDRDTYDTISPEYLRYVDADPTLNADAKLARKLNVQAWGIRIRHAEGAAK